MVDFGCYTNFSEVYQGTISKTMDGYTCQPWVSQLPHRHGYTPSNYPHSNLTSNFCRNPEGIRAKPWCYVNSSSNNITWQYCNIPSCGNLAISTGVYPLGGK